jgi:hypothetical protein
MFDVAKADPAQHQTDAFEKMPVVIHDDGGVETFVAHDA